MFAALVEAIRSPLSFAEQHPERAERVPGLREQIAGALARGAALWLPRDTQGRLLRAEQVIRAEGFGAESLARVRAALAPLFEPGYALRALGQGVEQLRGVGPKVAQALSRRGLGRVVDLVFFLPRAYEDRRRLLSIADLAVGQSACFEARVVRSGTVRLRNGRSFFQAVVGDSTAAVSLKWFRGLEHFAERVRPGARLLVAGEVRRYRYAKELHHPDVELLDDETPSEALARIVPVYSAVEGIPPRTLARLVHAALDVASDLVCEHLPEGVAGELALPRVADSLRQVHRPGPHLDPDELAARRTPYHRRLAAEELFLLQVGLALRRVRVQARQTAPIPTRVPAVDRAVSTLPFALTEGQRVVWDEIAADLARARPMNRLLIGDVGTGKTVLAFMGAVAAQAVGGVTALLAPTELLAEQHAATLRSFARPLGLHVGLLTGSTSPGERRELARLLRLREIAVVVGTHALLSGSLPLRDLRFVVIDEQHRFGVEQRRVLPDQAERPHVLVMTATPIPRTLALTLYGDLDHSMLRERPPGRQPVRTRILTSDQARVAWDALRETVARGERAYVVYPLVEESEKQDLRDAARGFERLRDALPGVGVALVHGRLDAAKRNEAMQAFVAGRAQVLVATTVIEVGVDVPEATLLVVQHAERFGLAQLHQLRGRVGRGQRPASALLIGDAKSEDAARRLSVLERSESGFEIADEDLRIRGAGEWLGTRQAGRLPDLRLADLLRQADLLEPIREAAGRLVEADPDLEHHPNLRAAVEQRWGDRLALGDVM